MSSSPLDTWWHEGARASLPLAELRALVQAREIAPDVLTWPEGGNESFPACWHLDHWFTHPDLFDADRPRSLVEIFFEDQSGLFGEMTAICYAGGELWESLAEFEWAVPEHLWPAEPDLANADQTEVDGTLRHDVLISPQRKHKGKSFEARMQRRWRKFWRDAQAKDIPGKLNKAFLHFARAAVLWSRAAVLWSRAAVLWSRSALQSTWVKAKAKAEAARTRRLEKRLPADLPEPSNVLLPAQVDVLVRDLGTKDTAEAVTPLLDRSKLPKTDAKKKSGRPAKLPEFLRQEVPRAQPVSFGESPLEATDQEQRAIEIDLARRIAEQLESNPHLTAAETGAGRELVVLFFISFFDRPAETKLLPITFPPGTPLLTTANFPLTAPHLDAGDLRAALESLSLQGLVTRGNPATDWEEAQIDCPPLVRRYFGSRLAELNKTAHREAHGRLYDHLRFAGLPAEFQKPPAYALLAFLTVQAALRKHISALKTWPRKWERALPPTLFTAEWSKVQAAATLIDTPAWTEALARFLPTDEAGMTPLFAAIGHGCKAGREEEAWSEVYWPRVARGNEVYASIKLGLYGQELAALANFFQRPFAEPSPRLSRARQALLLNQTGFRLRTARRLEDAVAPMRSAIRLDEARDRRKSAAVNAGNLSDLLVTLGQLEGPEGAVEVAANSVTHADRSGDALERVDNRTIHGDALLRSGQARRAETLFREAERLQKIRQCGQPQLYSMAGYRYADLLLARGRAEEAKERAERMMEGEDQDSLLEKALYRLASARAHGALRSTPSAFPEALAALRRANSEEDLPRGLLAHAEASWLSGNRAEAETLLDEAEVIATRGPMPLFAADAALLRARIAHAAGDLRSAHAKRDEADILISRHGYGMRRAELSLLNAELGGRSAASTEMVPSPFPDTARYTPQPSDTPNLIALAIAAVEAEGWWALLPRLEALLKDREEFTNDRSRLREERDNHDRERDEYLASQT